MPADTNAFDPPTKTDPPKAEPPKAPAADVKPAAEKPQRVKTPFGVVLKPAAE